MANETLLEWKDLCDEQEAKFRRHGHIIALDVSKLEDLMPCLRKLARRLEEDGGMKSNVLDTLRPGLECVRSFATATSVASRQSQASPLIWESLQAVVSLQLE